MPKSFTPKFELGQTARDIITGYCGVITQHTRFLTGCDQYCLMPRELDKDGKRQIGEYFDESRIELVAGVAPVILDRPPKSKPGADESPPRSK